MLIITADDFGKNLKATDNTLQCFCGQRLTTASLMVFMEDSERAAAAASAAGLETGLHINFTLPFTARNVSPKLREKQAAIMSYLAKHRFSVALYHPKLADSFHYVFSTQAEEFQRLFSRPPDHYNGHNHMHLCANMLVGGLLPKGARIRRTYSFRRGEKGIANRFYRYLQNFHISNRFVTTDTFFSIDPIQNLERIKKIVERAAYENVEIGVHPENEDEKEFLLSDRFLSLMRLARTGPYLSLPIR